MQKPELLSPAGNLEKLKIAFHYGADAVYLGLQKFGLRSAAENFNWRELQEACRLARLTNKKIFVVLNAYLHDQELEELPHYLKHMEQAGVNAVIVSDLGVVRCVLENSSIPVHLSTQASCLNYRAAQLWKNIGVERIVLGREISLAAAAAIKDKVGIELEMFIHGSMCMAFSGNCVISNYTQGRDSNRGGCAHSCRFQYKLEIPEGEGKREVSSFFMSSKDLNGIRLLPKYMAAGIDSLKIEGRMKNHLYLASITGAYRKAIDLFASESQPNAARIEEIYQEMQKLAHRDYTEASLLTPAAADSVYRDREKPESDYRVMGKILEVDGTRLRVLSKSNFRLGDSLELVDFSASDRSLEVQKMYELDGSSAEQCKPNRIYEFHLPKPASLLNGSILRSRSL